HVLVGPLGGAGSRVQGVDQVHAGDRQGRATHGDGAEDATDAGERDDGRDGRDATDDGEAFDQADGRSDDATGDDAERGAEEAAHRGGDAELAGELVLRTLVLDRRGDRLEGHVHRVDLLVGQL